MLQDTPKPYSPTNPEPIAGTPNSVLGEIFHRAEEVVEAVVKEITGAFSSDELVDDDGLAQAIAQQAAAAEAANTPPPTDTPVTDTPTTPDQAPQSTPDEAPQSTPDQAPPAAPAVEVPVVDTPVADPNAPSA